MIGRSLAHYEILGSIGRGGMGEVFRARDTRLGRDVALKVLPAGLARDPERMARFRREAQALAALNHENIVTVHSIDDVDGVAFITMELVDGSTLADLARGEVALDRLLRIATALASAVATAHAQGVVHRDLKPTNVMVSGEDRVKILDFGLAKLTRSADLEATTDMRTTPGTVVGTRAYMAPEQLQGRTVDERSDIFSLGVTLYELATGRHPFPGASVAERVSATLRDEPVSTSRVRSDIPDDIARAIDDCLAKSPADRPDARTLVERLSRRSEGPQMLGSVAVLAFADLSPERDQDYLCDGLADELMNAFTKIEGLKVASRTSCMQFKNVAADIRDVGRRLGVDTVVEGSVRKAGNRLRIHAQLTKVRDGYQLWTERYDRELEDVFEIQEDIATRIVDALELRLSPRERRAIQVVQTKDPRAYEFYLRGRQLQHALDRRSLESAREMFERAISIDPKYARAHCGIADCVSYLFMLHAPMPEHATTVAEASRRALELDPQLPEAYVSRGQAAIVAGDHAAADEAFETAIRLDPRLYEAYYFQGRNCFSQSRMVEARTMFEKAHALRPDDHQSVALLALTLEATGERESALQANRRSLELIRQHVDRNPGDVRARYFGANALIRLGETDEGLRWSRRARAMEPNDPHVAYNVACGLCRAEEFEEALDCLEAVAEKLEQSVYYGRWLRIDPDFGPMRELPRFMELVDRLPP